MKFDKVYIGIKNQSACQATGPKVSAVCRYRDAVWQDVEEDSDWTILGADSLDELADDAKRMATGDRRHVSDWHRETARKIMTQIEDAREYGVVE
jgi:hypothetical protein